MYVSELSREQLVELKSTMLEAILGYEPSYGELAIADELVSDEQVANLRQRSLKRRAGRPYLFQQ